MRIPRFYCETSLRDHDTLGLEGQAAHHLLRVLRRRVGDPVCLFDGHGGEYQATVQAIGRNRVELAVTDYCPDDYNSTLHSHLGLALSKGERMDWAIQKCTELGIDVITPLLTERCAVRLDSDRQHKKVEHWQRIARSACEQCGRNRVPTIAPSVRLSDWLAGIQADLGLIAHPQGTALATLAQFTTANDMAPTTLAILVGPEGGFTEGEVAQAQHSGFQLARVGPRILRTETAPVTILSIAQYLWGDLGAPPAHSSGAESRHRSE